VARFLWALPFAITLLAIGPSQAQHTGDNLIEVPNNSALETLQRTGTFLPTYVVREGYTTAGDAPPLFYYYSSSACSLNSGSGDNGSQVQASEGGCWLAVFPASGADVREWGVVADNTTDNSTTLQNALNWAAAKSEALRVPPGTVYWATELAVTLPTGGSLTLAGAGADVSMLRPGGTTGIVITKTSGDPNSNFHLRDFSCLASAAGANTCVQLVAQGNIPAPGYAAGSDIIGVTFRGSDGYKATNCWANDVTINYWSMINFINDQFVGCNTPTGIGIALTGGSNINTAGVVYNITSANFIGLTQGLLYGPWIQGVTVGQSNFTGNTNGIYVPSGELAGVAQLTVIGTQFGNNTYAVLDQTGVPSAIYQGNLLIVYANQVGIQTVADACVVQGNDISAASNVETYGLIFTGPGAGCTVNGNLFEGFNVGLVLDAGVTGIVERGDQMLSNRLNIQNKNKSFTDAISSTLECCGGPQNVTVSGATSHGGFVELTVSSTSGFISGNMVTVQGISGSTGNGQWVVQVVDGTHLLIQAAFAGRYRGGGIVSMLP
jgi:hypothetical protein